MKDWELVGVNLKAVFQSLAELKADMTINEDDTSEELPRLHPKVKYPLHRYSEAGVLSDLQLQVLLGSKPCSHAMKIAFGCGFMGLIFIHGTVLASIAHIFFDPLLKDNVALISFS